MSRQRELFDGTFEIKFIWRIGETFDWTIDFDLTIYLMERAALRRPANLRLGDREWILFD